MRLSLGRPGDAIASLGEAVRLAPTWPAVLDQLARVLTTARDPGLRDPERAVELAEGAREQSGGVDPSVLDTLAGDARRAVTAGTRALHGWTAHGRE